NLSVIKSDVTITIDNLGTVYGQPINVSGTISATNYSVWVNGVPATVNDLYHTWATPYPVPVPTGRTTVINVTGISNNNTNTMTSGSGTVTWSNNGNPTSTNSTSGQTTQDDEPYIRVTTYTLN